MSKKLITKSDIVKKYCKRLGIKVKNIRLSKTTIGDLKGIPLLPKGWRIAALKPQTELGKAVIAGILDEIIRI
jgi:hypothetical protein